MVFSVKLSGAASNTRILIIRLNLFEFSKCSFIPTAFVCHELSCHYRNTVIVKQRGGSAGGGGGGGGGGGVGGGGSLR